MAIMWQRKVRPWLYCDRDFYMQSLLKVMVVFVLVSLFGACDPDLPGSFDWRDNGGNFVTSPKDEGSCASCWAFAAAGMVESWCAIKNGITNPDTDLSEQTLISCSHDGSRTHGGDMGEALDFI